MFAVALTAKVNDAGCPSSNRRCRRRDGDAGPRIQRDGHCRRFPGHVRGHCRFCRGGQRHARHAVGIRVRAWADSVPTSAEKLTGTLVMACPVLLSTRAEITDVPPDAPSVCGVADSTHVIDRRAPDQQILDFSATPLRSRP